MPSSSDSRIGLLSDGTASSEQHAASEWLDDRFEYEHVNFEELADATEQVDVLWWHRAEPIAPGLVAAHRSTIQSFLQDGGGLLLTLRAMEVVEALGVDAVSPDATGTEEHHEPAGILWKAVYDDHPAATAFDSLRIPLSENVTAPFACYETVLPTDGEPLAGTVRDGRDIPHELSVISWRVGEGSVLGIGAPFSLADSQPEWIVDNLTSLLEGCLRSLAEGHNQPSRPMTAVELGKLRERLSDDPTRPRYHVTPPANWLNDPNGLIRWNGRYHVFYQYNPGGPFHNTIHWGHAVSDDLVTWTDMPVALTPTPGGPDQDGCWSGCAVDNDGTPTILYTGGNGRTQLPCLATSTDRDLRQWETHDENPVIDAPPVDLDILATDHWEAEFRDHNIWRADDTWYHLIGTGLVDDRGAVLLYTSDDLHEWSYEGPLLVGQPGAPDTVWECPELLDLGDTQLLHVSNYETVRYFIGELHDTEFEVDHKAVLDPGDFYAPQSLRDDDRYLMWGWLPEARSESAQWDAGWSGALSLPREISVGADGQVRQRPAAEIRDLRESLIHEIESTVLVPDDRHRFDGSRQLEIECTVGLDDATAFELSVFQSPDNEEQTVIRYTREGELIVDRTSASTDERAATDSQQITVTPSDEPLSLQVFLDGSVIELYANERHCLSSRVYPTRADSTGVSLTAEGGRTTVDSLAAWELGSAVV